MNIPEFNEIVEPNDQTEARREHLEKLRRIVGNVYPNKFERSRVTGSEDTISRVVAFAKAIKDKYISPSTENEKPADEQREAANAGLNQYRVRVAGRLAVPPRVMGKAAFVHLSDGAGRLQIYVRKQDAKIISNNTGKVIEDENAAWEVFNLLDHGDFVGVEGYLFVTKTGELSVHVETIQFLSKAMLPMPDKMHGIEDPEIKQRQRYADLIASSLRIKSDEEIEAGKQSGAKELTTREVFEIRSKTIREMRRFLDDHDYIEVETPMLTPKATGAAAKPFQTHHNALGIDLYARIAPELYLKRLVVGGFEKVYELNRNFRNEGISSRHNPEFTMLEFYCAYMDVNGMMDFCEQMIKESVQKAAGNLQVKYGGYEIDFSKFERLSMKEAVHKILLHNTELQKAFEEGKVSNELYVTFSDFIGEKYDISWLEDAKKIRSLAVLFAKSKARFSKPTGEPRLIAMTEDESKEYKAKLARKINYKKEIVRKMWQEAVAETEQQFNSSEPKPEQTARDLVSIFEEFIEPALLQPTFIVDYPKSISPLSKASPNNPNIAERFELFINGMECANGFSELNDPREQYERFRDQMKERETGDEEAMVLDEDYIRALAYGMPPAAGIGIGIDRIVMLLTNRQSIRDVILFPHLRPERRDEEKKEEETAKTSATDAS